MLKRGKTGSTHETRKLHYRADVLRLHHDYNVVVLMHKKHGGGHNIYKYGTPGVAYDFIGDKTTMVAPCREGQLFLNLYAAFCEARCRQKGKNTTTSTPSLDELMEQLSSSKESTGVEDPRDSSKEPPQRRPTDGQLFNESTCLEEHRDSSKEPQRNRQTPGQSSKKSIDQKEPRGSSKEPPRKRPTARQSPKESTALGELSRSSQEPPRKRSTAGQSPKESTGQEEPRDSPKELPHRQIAGSHGTEETSVVFYQVDDKYLAVGYLQPSRRTLHGQTLPAGVDVVLVTWVDSKEEEVPPPLVIGDPEENAKLCPGQFFAFPRTCLAKVKVI